MRWRWLHNRLFIWQFIVTTTFRTLGGLYVMVEDEIREKVKGARTRQSR